MNLKVVGSTPTRGVMLILDQIIYQRQNMTIKEEAIMYGMLSCELRLKVLRLLKVNKLMTVTELCKQLKQTQPLVSAHLAKLKGARIVDSKRNGKYNQYYITSEHVLVLV